VEKTRVIITACLTRLETKLRLRVLGGNLGVTTQMKGKNLLLACWGENTPGLKPEQKRNEGREMYK